jgi:hypothetical protein
MTYQQMALHSFELIVQECFVGADLKEGSATFLQFLFCSRRETGKYHVTLGPDCNRAKNRTTYFWCAHERHFLHTPHTPHTPLVLVSVNVWRAS